mmetsp:Transcript_11504/g.21244  ORF Transcript_11504/g.21244 Transcript_11504/m.21244 type:complete len:214 (-) Transcript_11504:38-679(-)
MKQRFHPLVVHNFGKFRLLLESFRHVFFRHGRNKLLHLVVPAVRKDDRDDQHLAQFVKIRTQRLANGVRQLFEFLQIEFGIAVLVKLCDPRHGQAQRLLEIHVATDLSKAVGQFDDRQRPVPVLVHDTEQGFHLLLVRHLFQFLQQGQLRLQGDHLEFNQRLGNLRKGGRRRNLLGLLGRCRHLGSTMYRGLFDDLFFRGRSSRHDDSILTKE